jgi:hypothetical protein
MVAKAVMLMLTLAMAGSATPVTWYLKGITLDDGAAVVGSFTFDADAGTACSLAVAPCGTYSNVNITTTGGGGLLAETYQFVCGTDVPTCNDAPGDSTEVLFLTSNSADQSGLQALAMLFTGVDEQGLPPAGLTDAGGIIDMSNSSSDVGAVLEATCFGSGCFAPMPPASISVSGTVESVPEPSSTLLLGASLAWLGRRAYRSRRPC